MAADGSARLLADGRVALDGGVGDLSGLRALDHDARTLYHHCSVAPLSSTRAPAYRRAVAVNIAGSALAECAQHDQQIGDRDRAVLVDVGGFRAAIVILLG